MGGSMVHLAGGLGLALLAGLGLVGLGRSAGARSLPLAWVLGWTAVWWPTALAAVAAGPRVGAAVGAALLVLGAVLWAARTSRERRLPELAAGCAAVAAGAPFFMVPPHFFDSLVYHLGLPWSWLANGTLAPMEHNLFQYFPLAGSMVYLVPVWLGFPGTAAGLHWLTFAVALAAAWEVARRLGAGRAAWFAPACLLGTWHAVWVAGVAAADHLVAAGVLVGAGLLLAPTEDEEGSRWTVPAGGLALGLALAAKYQGVLPALAVLGALVLVRPRRTREAATAGAVAVGAASFWYLRNLVLAGNPVFPLLANLFGGPGWTPRDEARFAAQVHEGVHGPWSLLEGLRMLLADGPGLGVWVLLAALLGIVAVGRAHGRPGPKQVGTAVLLMLLAWLVTSQTTRYAIPMAGLLGSLGAAGLARLARPTRRVAAAAMVLLVAWGGFLFLRFAVGALHMDALWFRRVDAETWRHRVTVNDPLPAYRAAAPLLGKGNRLLVVGEGRPWGCPGPHQVSSPYDTQLVQEIVERSPGPGEVADALAGRGFGLLVINHGEISRLREGFGMLRWERERDRATWLGFLAAHTRAVWREGDLEIRRLLPGKARRDAP